MSQSLSKYIATFDYIDKALIVLSATRGVIRIISFTSVVGVPVGTASASFSLAFSLATGIIKELLKIIRNKMKKHKTIFMVAKIKLNSIGTLVSEAIIDLEINHKDFNTIINEEENSIRLER